VGEQRDPFVGQRAAQGSVADQAVESKLYGGHCGRFQAALCGAASRQFAKSAKHQGTKFTKLLTSRQLGRQNFK
jgi:hypothetical protein